ncbi:uncharacterized protein LOC143523446 [Brachyhypopomus gauderio]|uniref:uncharacterized protein LOC143523446 n=1 Tax=Brachyhypopomus gauderio TaxID=698409 RepID=UPI004041C139
MTQSTKAKNFLKSQRSEIINGVRNVQALVDHMLENQAFKSEIASKIRAKSPEHDQVREVLDSLNCSKHYDLMVEWLKENEPGLMHDIGYSSDEGPERKRIKIQEKVAVDEMDTQVNKIFDLKTLFTFAKLEEWMSESDSEKLIENLKHKLRISEIETLEKKLKNKKLKKSLCFNAEDVKKIKSNQELKSFLYDVKKNAKFPDLTLKIFFENDTGSTLTSNGFIMERRKESYTDNHAKDEKNADSVYGSLCSSSGKNDIGAEQVDDDGLSASEPRSQGGESAVKEQIQFHAAHSQTQNDTEDLAPLEGTIHQERNEQLSQQNKDTVVQPQEQIELGLNALSRRQHQNQSTRRQLQNQRNLSKNNMVYNWAMKKCSGKEESGKNVLDCISIRNKVEHSEYPIFVADNIMVYENPQSGEKHIIFVTDEKVLKRKEISGPTRMLIDYQMWVCGIKKTVVLKKVKDEEEEHEFDYKQFDDIVELCQKFILEAFLPAFAVLKKLQRESQLYSLIPKGSSENP